MGGDFNCFASLEEKVGGNMSYFSSMIDFQGFIAAAGMMDASFVGNPFTWTNKQAGGRFIKARLDRVLLNTEWTSFLPNGTVKHLTRDPSDHCPLLYSSIDGVKPPSRFIF